LVFGFSFFFSFSYLSLDFERCLERNPRCLSG